jgi:uncharacterized protein Smg (DUF494 family)
MQERIIEIIIFLLEQFQQKPDKDSGTDLSEELASRGYTDHEINLAFSWVTNHLQTRSMNGSNDYDTAPAEDVDLEKLIITPEAYGYLIQVYHLGMLKEYDIEDVIDRALSVGSNHITLDDVKKVTAAIIFNSEPGSNNLFFQSGSNSIH